MPCLCSRSARVAIKESVQRRTSVQDAIIQRRVQRAQRKSAAAVSAGSTLVTLVSSESSVSSSTSRSGDDSETGSSRSHGKRRSHTSCADPPATSWSLSNGKAPARRKSRRSSKSEAEPRLRLESGELKVYVHVFEAAGLSEGSSWLRSLEPYVVAYLDCDCSVETADGQRVRTPTAVRGGPSPIWESEHSAAVDSAMQLRVGVQEDPKRLYLEVGRLPRGVTAGGTTGRATRSTVKHPRATCANYYC